MFVRLPGKLLLKRMNIPLRHSAFATRRCPSSKGELLELRPDLIILSKSIKTLWVYFWPIHRPSLCAFCRAPVCSRRFSDVRPLSD